MQNERFKIHLCVYLVLTTHDDKVLLHLRQNTGYEDGKYGLVGGHADGNETVRESIAREAFEESGIIIAPEDIRHLHTMHRISNRENIDMFFTADTWQGTLTNAEPDKCKELVFHPRKELPHNTIDYIRYALDMIHKGVVYSEFGWSNCTVP